MIRRSLATLVLVLAAASLAFAGDFNGKWEGNIKTPDGQNFPVAFDFKVDGDKLTGNVTSSMGTEPIENGKVSGDTITFTVDAQGQKITHEATMAGDVINVKSHSPWGDFAYELKHPAAK